MTASPFQDIYHGAVSVKPATPASQAMVAAMDPLLRKLLPEAEHPGDAEHVLGKEVMLQRVMPLRMKIRMWTGWNALVKQLLEEQGYDTEGVIFDTPHLRVAPIDVESGDGSGDAPAAHRDTWSAHSGAQVNWWIPLYDLPREAALPIFPAYFKAAVANSSSGFDYLEIKRRTLFQDTEGEVVTAPTTTEPFDMSNEQRFAMNAAETLVFSGSHLHGGARNLSNRTRFSVDFRTVRRPDHDAGIGVANVDSAAVGSSLIDFYKFAA